MRIVLGSDEKTPLTEAVAEDLRGRGHDVVLVETVGVGQSETSVANMVDIFIVVAIPGNEQGPFPPARAMFDEADPEKRDGRTQFYIAYSFYRQGWGRFSNDDEKEFQASYSRVSQWAKRHDKSVLVNYVAPEPQTLEKELDLVDSWFKRVRGYKN